MKRIALLVALAATPLAAQEPPAPEAEAPSLMEEGAKMFLRGLMSEMEPTLNDMQGALEALGPKLEELKPQILELIGMIDDFQNYHAPEKLPNGDILIRRKTAQELEAEKAAPEGPPAETEL
ncbi:hypothetical protein [Tabrizicola fusiformis]|uniref:hypothetical protein n=1 Tax=Tabrizicola sp. SY72 TaxID=2741673 RepID=UPI0015730237|nr:hypothetical protein [Tabrizicola sp. SY72]NTT86223.1 hypothetical protein [Tabrizicola sp. SY72]